MSGSVGECGGVSGDRHGSEHENREENDKNRLVYYIGNDLYWQ